MKLNDFKSAWKQQKLLNALQYIDSKEILAIIDRPENVSNNRQRLVVLNTIMFIVLIICCQGG